MWEETVMSDGGIHAIVEEWYKTTPLYEALVLMGAKAQAEITGKIAYEEGEADGRVKK